MEQAVDESSIFSFLVKNLTAIMMVGVIAIVVLGQISRLWSGALGIAFWISIALIGIQAYEQGGQIGIAGFDIALPKMGFLILCGVLVLLNAATLLQALSKRRSAKIQEAIQKELHE